MADLVIRGMDMPTNVNDCPLNTFGYCNLAQDSDHVICIGDSRPEWCPLVPLPEGHGRLGDLDALEKELAFDYAYAAAKVCRNAPTVIPAEGGTDNEHV